MCRKIATVHAKGVYCDGDWYYHPAILENMNQTVMIEILDEDSKIAAIYDSDGTPWNGIAYGDGGDE